MTLGGFGSREGIALLKHNQDDVSRRGTGYQTVQGEMSSTGASNSLIFRHQTSPFITLLTA